MSINRQDEKRYARNWRQKRRRTRNDNKIDVLLTKEQMYVPQRPNWCGHKHELLYSTACTPVVQLRWAQSWACVPRFTHLNNQKAVVRGVRILTTIIQRSRLTEGTYIRRAHIHGRDIHTEGIYTRKGHTNSSGRNVRWRHTHGGKTTRKTHAHGGGGVHMGGIYIYIWGRGTTGGTVNKGTTHEGTYTRKGHADGGTYCTYRRDNYMEGIYLRNNQTKNKKMEGTYTWSGYTRRWHADRGEVHTKGGEVYTRMSLYRIFTRHIEQLYNMYIFINDRNWTLVL